MASGPAGHDAAAVLDLDESLTLSLQDASVGEVLARLAALLGAELDIPEELEAESVTVEIERMRVRDALSTICGKIGCSWWLDERTQALVFRPTGAELGIRIALRPTPDYPDAYRCIALITDLETGEVLSAPTIIFRRGEGASVTSGLDDGGIVSLDVAVDADEDVAEIVVEVTRDGKVVARQSSTFRFEPPADGP